MPNILAGLKRLTIGQVGRMAATYFGVMATVWFGIGPVITVYAGDVIEQIFADHGVGPKVIAEMQAQGILNGKSIDELSTDADKIKTDLRILNQQIAKVSDQIANQDGNIDDLKKLLGQLLQAQLGNRADSGVTPQ